MVVVNLVYGGISAAPSCDLSVCFTNTTTMASCVITSAFFIPSPPGTTHGRIATASLEFSVDFNWFANQTGACRQTLDLVTGQWKQMALSCNPPAGSNTVQALLGDDLTPPHV